MGVYEIINPSDPYTMEAEFPVACAACLVLGEGRYALQPGPGTPEDQRLPLFLFAGSAALAWFEETFATSLGAFLDANRPAIAAALESVLIGRFADRQDFVAALAAITEDAAREKYRAERHDRHCSSSNDIGRRALRIAKRIRQMDAMEADGQAKESIAP